MNFAEATAVQQKDSHTYTADLSPEWVIGSVPHGGYVTSLFLSVVKAHFSSTLRAQNQPHTLALHLDFLRRTGVGPGTFTIQDVKLGRQTSVVHVTLAQENRQEVVGYVTNSNLTTETGASFPTHWTLAPAVPAADVSRFDGDTDPQWAEKREWPHVEFRKATRRIRSWFPRGGQASPSLYDQWTCLRELGEMWTNEGLGFLVDLFPQLLESYLLDGLDTYDPRIEEKYSAAELAAMTKDKAPFWYPTLLLNLEVKKALPAEGVRFLFSRVRAKTIKNGRYDLEVVVMDEGGEVVALSHHVCFAVSAARNVAARRKVEEEPKL